MGAGLNKDAGFGACQLANMKGDEMAADVSYCNKLSFVISLFVFAPLHVNAATFCQLGDVELIVSNTQNCADLDGNVLDQLHANLVVYNNGFGLEKANQLDQSPLSGMVKETGMFAGIVAGAYSGLKVGDKIALRNWENSILESGETIADLQGSAAYNTLLVENGLPAVERSIIPEIVGGVGAAVGGGLMLAAGYDLKPINNCKYYEVELFTKSEKDCRDIGGKEVTDSKFRETHKEPWHYTGKTGFGLRRADERDSVDNLMIGGAMAVSGAVGYLTGQDAGASVVGDSIESKFINAEADAMNMSMTDFVETPLYQDLINNAGIQEMLESTTSYNMAGTLGGLAGAGVGAGLVAAVGFDLQSPALCAVFGYEMLVRSESDCVAITGR